MVVDVVGAIVEKQLLKDNDYQEPYIRTKFLTHEVRQQPDGNCVLKLDTVPTPSNLYVATLSFAR